MEYHLPTMRSVFRVEETAEFGSEPREIVVETNEGIKFRMVLAGKSAAMPLSVDGSVDPKINEMAVDNIAQLNTSRDEISAAKACIILGFVFCGTTNGIKNRTQEVGNALVLHFYSDEEKVTTLDFDALLFRVFQEKGLRVTLGELL